MQNQAMRRGGRNGGEVDDFATYANDPEGRHPSDLGLRAGQHYDPQGYEDYRAPPEEPQAYDPRAYAPNPDDAFEYDANGEPVYYDPHYRPARANRSGLVMVAAVAAVALLGGAGALGYRMMGQGGVLSGEPPLIKADVQPSKTVPEAAVADNSHQNKQIYDRVGVNPAQKSKVVSREEEPVELPASAAPAANADSARVILPGGPAAVEPVAPTTMGSEPRRVKTVEIKPDSSYDADPVQSRTAASDPIGQMTAAGQAPGAASEFDNGIMSDGGAAAPAAARAKPAAPAPVAARPQPTPVAPVAPVAQAPASRPTPAPAAAPARPAQAAVQPRDQQVATAAPPRPAAPAAPAPRASAGGGYVVQVTSQRSDADARTAYATLQRKFPQVLGGYSANVQAANLGERGTYYRVRVGPFADGAQASTVCGNLRAAGGDCVVSRN